MALLAVCSVVTYNHLHTALCLVKSIRRRWTTQPPVFIALVDHTNRPRPGLEQVPGVEFIDARSLDVPNLDWQLCKLTPFEACCVIKPFLMRRLLERGFDTVLHVDNDILFFGDGMSFVDDMGRADLLVTPHVLSPLPFNEPWLRVSMGQLAEAGVLNTGLVGARNTSGARSFLDTWGRLCSGPGAFMRDLGNQNEQQYFNWVLAFSDNVRICRDPRVNVAYWNLHERPIRWGGLDDRERDLWFLDGQPITCFHFSGFDWDRGRLSTHDDRARPYVNANLFALCEYYTQALADSGRAHYGSVPYEFGAVDDFEIDHNIRIELKRSEAKGALPAKPWPDMGRAALEKLTRTLGQASVVPAFLEPVQQRGDLHPFHDHLFPPAWIRWADRSLWQDHPAHGLLYEGFGPFVYHRAYFAHLVQAIQQIRPALTEASIVELLKRRRPQLLQQLEGDAAVSDHVRASIGAALYRLPAFVPAVAIRLLYAESARLQEHFPDVAGGDFPGFRDWLAGADDVLDYPQDVREFIATLDFERSMARVLGKSVRIPILLARIRRDGYNRTHLTALVGAAQNGYGYDANDLVLADWWLAHLGEAAVRRIRTLILPEAGDVGFRDYLTEWCARRGVCDASTPPEAIADVVVALEQRIVDGSELTDVAAMASAATPHLAERVRAALLPEPRGVNVFGYFRSPIGLGTATAGLCRALECGGYPHQKLVIPNDALDADFTLDDLFQDYAFAYPRNIVVSYPHIEYQLQAVQPRCFFDGRETIGYFAWEQRDFPLSWAARLAPYDKLCALSRFAAKAIARGVGRPVAVLPCVVETGPTVPKAMARARFGIPDGKFVVGFVFDAASSIERKNPLAVIDAVEKAFGGSNDVVFVLKVGSGRRPDFALQMAEIARRMAALPGSMIIVDYLSRRDVEALICAMDVYVSLHRSEGFGYTLAEAMLFGVPTVATGYSGNLDFMTDDNAHLVTAREVLVTARDGPFETGTMWAEPNIDHAVEILRRIRLDYAAASRRAADAVDDLTSLVSPAAVARALTAIIDGSAYQTSRRERTVLPPLSVTEQFRPA